MNPQLSVLMCVHNGEAYLQEAIDSILSQTYSDFEFVIVENCSSDRSYEILNSQSDQRIRVFQTNIKQLSYNLNFGLLQCKGKWVARMDADDISKPDRLEKQLNFLEQNPDVVVLGSQSRLFDETGEKGLETVPLSDLSIRRALPFRKALLHPTVVFHREKVLGVGGYLGGRLGQDFDLWLRLARDSKNKFANLKEPYLDYRVHSQQARGSRESYASSASYLLREFLISLKPKFLLGCLTFALKGFFRGK